MHLPVIHTSEGRPVLLFRKAFIRLLFRLSGILVLIHLINLATGFPSWQLERLFALGEENNIPTWFSSWLWALNAFVAYRCSSLETGLRRNLWLLIAGMFLVFSIDEVAAIHERFFEMMSRYFPLGFQSAILSHFKATSWPIIAAPFMVMTVIWLKGTFKRLSIGQPVAQLIAAGFFLVIFGGYGLEITTNFLNHDELEWLWQLESVFEESLEMIGSILILSGLLSHLSELQIDALGDKKGAMPFATSASVLFLISAILVLFHILSITVFNWSFQWERLFDLDLERNIPTWFSSFLWGLAALSAFECFRRSENDQINFWMWFSFFLLLLSCDEVASAHENIGLTLSKYLSPLNHLGMRSWSILLLPFILPLFFWLIQKLRGCLKEASKAVKLLVFGGLFLLAGSLSLELVTIPLSTQRDYALFIKMEPIFEEFLEMAGIILLVWGLMTHIKPVTEQNEIEEFIACQA